MRPFCERNSSCQRGCLEVTVTLSKPRFAALALLCTIALSTPSQATTRTLVPVPPPPASAPGGVNAVPGNAKVILTWAPVAGAAGYRVFRGANGRWAPAPIATTTGTTHTSYSLTNGTTYSFTVAAYTKGGNGPLSLTVAATPLAPPTGITAASGDTRVTLNWVPSAGASTYTVYRKFGSDLVFSELTTGVLEPPFIDNALTNGTRYYYQLRAVSGAAQSELSAKVSAVPLPPPPVGAVVLAAVAGNARATLTWNALPDATSYKIYRSTSGVFDGPAIASTTTTTAFKNTGLTNGEFNRTGNANANQGTDHAWGGHHMVIGGAVAGGQVYGTFPTHELRGPDDAGDRGNWIPTTSLDQYAATLGGWFGVPDADLQRIFPNLANFAPQRLGFV